MTGKVTVAKHTRRRTGRSADIARRHGYLRHREDDDMTDQDYANMFLDDLRESGVTNMFGAAPYLEREFGVDKKTARAMLAEWMRTFEARHPRP